MPWKSSILQIFLYHYTCIRPTFSNKAELKSSIHMHASTFIACPIIFAFSFIILILLIKTKNYNVQNYYIITLQLSYICTHSILHYCYSHTQKANILSLRLICPWPSSQHGTKSTHKVLLQGECWGIGDAVGDIFSCGKCHSFPSHHQYFYFHTIHITYNC